VRGLLNASEDYARYVMLVTAGLEDRNSLEILSSAIARH
jgi:hypothetical protein